jgi:hypothetical protein
MSTVYRSQGRVDPELLTRQQRKIIPPGPLKVHTGIISAGGAVMTGGRARIPGPERKEEEFRKGVKRVDGPESQAHAVIFGNTPTTAQDVARTSGKRVGPDAMRGSFSGVAQIGGGDDSRSVGRRHGASATGGVHSDHFIGYSPVCGDDASAGIPKGRRFLDGPPPFVPEQLAPSRYQRLVMAQQEREAQVSSAHYRGSTAGAVISGSATSSVQGSRVVTPRGSFVGSSHAPRGFNIISGMAN